MRSNVIKTLAKKAPGGRPMYRSGRYTIIFTKCSVPIYRLSEPECAAGVTQAIIEG